VRQAKKLRIFVLGDTLYQEERSKKSVATKGKKGKIFGVRESAVVEEKNLGKFNLKWGFRGKVDRQPDEGSGRKKGGQGGLRS